MFLQSLIEFLYWLKNAIGNETVTEYDIGVKLKECRERQKDFKGESFPPIVGYKEHGAIVHLSVGKDDALKLSPEGILLFDSGDIFQGTPYFNFYGGELEMKLMSKLKYDAGTIGNHDFDGGIEGLAKQLNHASFPMLIANYDLSNTVMHNLQV